MLRRALTVLLTAAFLAAGVPASGGSPPDTPRAKGRAQPPARGSGTISGTAQDEQKQPIAGTLVRLRNADTGALVSTTVTTAKGEYVFTLLQSGNYIVEVVNVAGNIIGTSSTISLTAGAMTASGVVVSSTLATTLAAAGGAGGAFVTSTLGIVTLATVATVATIATIQAVKNNASGAR